MGVIKRVEKPIVPAAGRSGVDEDDEDNVEYTIATLQKDYRLKFTRNKRLLAAPSGFRVEWR